MSGAKAVTSARRAYCDYCLSLGTTAIDEENAALSVGREFLPPCALAVLDDRDAATVEYYQWLTDGTAAAQAEHDAEYAAGHESLDRGPLRFPNVIACNIRHSDAYCSL